MATESEHLKHAQDNQRFLDSVDQALFTNWSVTVAFYKGVHLVEALFVRYAVPTKSHSDRNDQMKRHYPHLWKHYRPLFAMSHTARYSCQVITIRMLDAALRYLERLENTILAELGV